MQGYTYAQVLEKSTEYFNGDDFAAKVFVDKYALQNKEGVFLEITPTDMHHRLAKEFARIEQKYPNPLSEDRIFDLIDHFKYIVPQGSPMSAIGNPYQLQSLSNCFVVQGVYSNKLDSYGGIMLADQELAQIMKRRGGCGLDISGIRPKDTITANAAKTTDGIGVFMERFSNTCREVAQNGRRGAEMITISVNHPEIETFINIKKNLKKVTGANISIRFNNEFMNAVKNNEKYDLRWPVDASVKDAKIVKTVDAKNIWDQVVDAAWTSAEPGLLFWDNVKETTPADIYEAEGYGSISTNPCGEIVLSAYDACRLLVLNLSSYVDDPFTPDATFNYHKFHEHTVIAQKLMDDIIDLEIECIDRIIAKVESDPEPEEAKAVELNLWKKIRKANIGGRRTGLGITALGDCLAMMGIKYGSKESIEATKQIYRALALGAHTSSCVMAKERGAFPVFSYEKEKNHAYLKSIMKDAGLITKWKKHGRRNIALTTTAPTGSVSTLTRTTSGIEPAYLLSYVRRKKINPSDKSARVDFTDMMGDRWQEFTIYHHGVKQWMDVTGETDIMKSPYWGATSNEIDWMASVDMQAAAQKSVDHSISKTCNLPSNVTKEVVSQVYMRAWESGCKGFTVYRDGCRTGVLMSEESAKKARSPSERPVDVEYVMAPKRPIELSCEIRKAKVLGESWTIFVGLLNGKPYEVFGGLSKYVDIPNKYKSGKIIKNGKNADGLTTYNLVVGDNPDDRMIIKDIADIFENKTHEAFTRMISLNLRHGTPIQYVVEQLTKDKYAEMTSFSRVVARVLKSYIKDGVKSTLEKKCNSCDSEGSLVYQEGCIICTKCGYSKCG